MIDLPVVKLLEPLKCTECGYLHAVVPLEDSDRSPVHCRECGAFLCFWADALAMAKLDIGRSAMLEVLATRDPIACLNAALVQLLDNGKMLPSAITKLLDEPGQ